MANNGNKTSAASARKLKHQAQALELRRAGMAYAAIGQRLGISKSRAHALVQLGFEETRKQITSSADEVKVEELSRLDGMLMKVYPKAAKGELQAIDRVLKIAERRARLLGLDAPVRTALQGGGEDAPPLVTEARVTVYIPSNGREGGGG